MDYQFSQRISALQPSAIREIFKLTADPGIIPFAAGSPSPATFAGEELSRLAAEILLNESALALQYGITEGMPDLRALTAARAKIKYGVGRDFDDLIIVAGGQQGIDLTAKVFLNEGDVVFCENPSFIGALNTFRAYNAQLRPIPVEDDGMDLNALEAGLRSEPRARLIYAIPTYQNPSGKVMSEPKREALLKLAAQYNVMILEDDPYHDLRYEGEDVRTIKSMDDEGRVIFVGSYSKIIAPGLRIGYVAAPQPVIAKMTVGKQTADVHTNQLAMVLVARYLQNCDLDAHIERCRARYKNQRDVMVDGLRREMGDRISFEVPRGGLFLWLGLPEGTDSAAFCKKAVEFKVAGVPGNAFEVDDSKPSRFLRLNFSMVSEEQIVEGVRRLAQTLDSFMK